MQYIVYKHEHVAGNVKLVDRPAVVGGGGDDMAPQMTNPVMVGLLT